MPAENVLGKVRDGVLTATPDTVTLVLAALDRIKAIVGRPGRHRQRAGGRRCRTDRGAERRGGRRGSEAGAAAVHGRAGARAGASRAEPPAVASRRAPPRPRAPSPPPAHAAAPTAANRSPANQTIRVTVDVLEDLMTLVSELVLTRNQLLQLARTQGEQRASPCRCSGCRTSPPTCRKG